jgi:hypothetical protein
MAETYSLVETLLHIFRLEGENGVVFGVGMVVGWFGGRTNAFVVTETGVSADK